MKISALCNNGSAVKSKQPLATMKKCDLEPEVGRAANSVEFLHLPCVAGFFVGWRARCGQRKTKCAASARRAPTRPCANYPFSALSSAAATMRNARTHCCQQCKQLAARRWRQLAAIWGAADVNPIVARPI